MTEKPLTELPGQPGGPDSRVCASRMEEMVMKWSLAAMAPFFLGGVMFMVAVMSSRSGGLWIWLVAAADFVLVLVAILVGRVVSRRALRRHDYLLCLKCRYPLSGLGSEGACPECGRQFRAEAVQLFWHARYR